MKDKWKAEVMPESSSSYTHAEMLVLHVGGFVCFCWMHCWNCPKLTLVCVVWYTSLFSDQIVKTTVVSQSHGAHIVL